MMVVKLVDLMVGKMVERMADSMVVRMVQKKVDHLGLAKAGLMVELKAYHSVDMMVRKLVV